MQYTEEERGLDVDSVLTVVSLDPEFTRLMRNMSYQSAAQAISEAINVLYSGNGPDKGQFIDVSPYGCLVIAILQQWLVRHLCKRLMQLMTPEALILYRNKIPSSYIKHHLRFFTPFSLLNLIKRYHQAVKSTNK